MVELVLDLVKEYIYKPFFAETFSLVKYHSLNKMSAKLLGADNLYSFEKGVKLLRNLDANYPQFRQEMIEKMCTTYSAAFEKHLPFDATKVPAQRAFLRAITSVKKTDENGFPYLFDLEKTSLYSKTSAAPLNFAVEESLPLEDYRRTNLAGFYLPGCFFMNINFNGSSFEGADLGGTVFYNCSLEFCNFKGAKICGSLFNESILLGQSENLVCFINTRLFGCNLHEADLTACKIRPHREEGREFLDSLQAQMPRVSVTDNDGVFLLGLRPPH